MAWDLADLANVAVEQTFKTSITYTRSAGGVSTFDAVFDRDFAAVDLGPAQVQLANRSPVVDVRLSAISFMPVVGDELTADGLEYVVEAVEPDGLGGARLILSESI
jgi:hypothetical protein